MKNSAKQTKQQNHKECIFCKIISGELPCSKVYENESVLAFKDISGDFPDHTIVVPKRHCDSILDASNCRLRSCILAIKEISNSFITKGYDGVNVFNNSGTAAEQTISHLHFHIIPRKIGDGQMISPRPKKN